MSNIEKSSEIMIPACVQENAENYHIGEFQQFASQVDIRGKHVLEIDSDYHLASARLLIANGDQEVIANNIGDWRSEEPLPKGISFTVCDVADADLPANSFDIVYGIAILEHIPDLVKVCQAIERFLRPDGVAYLQTRNGVPQQDATGIVRYVFNLDGRMVRSCSNFMAASPDSRCPGGSFRRHC